MFSLISSKIIAIFAGIAIASSLAWGGYQYIKLQRSLVETATFKAERDEAAAARDLAIAVNSKNVFVINELKQEKLDIQRSLKNLEDRRKKDAVSIDNLTSIINAQASNPENKVKLSPVLQEVIDQIQKSRKKKEEVK